MEAKWGRRGKIQVMSLLIIDVPKTYEIGNGPIHSISPPSTDLNFTSPMSNSDKLTGTITAMTRKSN